MSVTCNCAYNCRIIGLVCLCLSFWVNQYPLGGNSQIPICNAHMREEYCGSQHSLCKHKLSPHIFSKVPLQQPWLITYHKSLFYHFQSFNSWKTEWRELYGNLNAFYIKFPALLIFVPLYPHSQNHLIPNSWLKKKIITLRGFNMHYMINAFLSLSHYKFDSASWHMLT